MRERFDGFKHTIRGVVARWKRDADSTPSPANVTEPEKLSGTIWPSPEEIDRVVTAAEKRLELKLKENERNRRPPPDNPNPYIGI